MFEPFRVDPQFVAGLDAQLGDAPVKVDILSAFRNTSEMEAVEALKLANAEFETRLRQVEHEQWDLPTPCPDWNVRALTNHVLLGTRMSIHVLSGMPRDEVISYLDDDMMASTDDPISCFIDLADEMTASFSGPEGLVGSSSTRRAISPVECSAVFGLPMVPVTRGTSPERSAPMKP